MGVPRRPANRDRDAPVPRRDVSSLAPVLLSGGAFYVMESFDPSGSFDLVAEHRISATLIVPVMLYALQGHPRYETADMSSMETIFYGAWPMSPGQARPGPFPQFDRSSSRSTARPEPQMVITHLKKGEHDLSRPSPSRLHATSPVPWMHVALLGLKRPTCGAGRI